ncbi:hypothetical protein SH2C18_13610 [Clostridium sediminicola]|uniref:DUF6557 family protein n=1 Tax=Clostridium sediminicola TaxID=3114879 RepID=UPI0031F1E3E9
MLFNEVFNKSNFDEVYRCLIDNYDDVKPSAMEKIKKGYEDVSGLIPSDNKEEMTILIRAFEEEGEKSYDVSGVEIGKEELYSLVFDEWENWLGYKIDNKNLEDMTYSEITAHCFWEMTFNGWTIEERKNTINEMCMGEEIKELSEDLKKENKMISDKFLYEILEKYKNAKTDSLKTDIEIEIEELIDAKLVTEKQVQEIKDNFDDEDVLSAVERF